MDVMACKARVPHLDPLDLFSGASIAIVHEWVSARAGSEKVFEALAQLFPTADLYALTVAPGVDLDVGGRYIRTTPLHRWQILREHREITLPLMPAAWQAIRGHYDIVITSAHAFARAFPAARRALHFSYIHAPARYLWTPDVDERRPPTWTRPLVAALKAYDQRTVAATNYLAANSTEVSERIWSIYGRASRIIPPPVDTERFQNRGSNSHRSGLLCLGRWVSYKKFDIAIRASARLDEPLTLAGRGPLRSALRRLADNLQAPVTFLESPTDAEVSELMATHRALLFPGREDFGIVPVEAAAAGLPTIAYGYGGALDTVVNRVTGLHVFSHDTDDWVEAIERSRTLAWDDTNLVKHAEMFSMAAFRSRVARWLTDP